MSKNIQNDPRFYPIEDLIRDGKYFNATRLCDQQILAELKRIKKKAAKKRGKKKSSARVDSNIVYSGQWSSKENDYLQRLKLFKIRCLVLLGFYRAAQIHYDSLLGEDPSNLVILESLIILAGAAGRLSEASAYILSSSSQRISNNVKIAESNFKTSLQSLDFNTAQKAANSLYKKTQNTSHLQWWLVVQSMRIPNSPIASSLVERLFDSNIPSHKFNNSTYLLYIDALSYAHLFSHHGGTFGTWYSHSALQNEKKYNSRAQKAIKSLISPIGKQFIPIDSDRLSLVAKICRQYGDFRLAHIVYRHLLKNVNNDEYLYSAGMVDTWFDYFTYHQTTQTEIESSRRLPDDIWQQIQDFPIDIEKHSLESFESTFLPTEEPEESSISNEDAYSESSSASTSSIHKVHSLQALHLHFGHFSRSTTLGILKWYQTHLFKSMSPTLPRQMARLLVVFISRFGSKPCSFSDINHHLYLLASKANSSVRNLLYNNFAILKGAQRPLQPSDTDIKGNSKEILQKWEFYITIQSIRFFLLFYLEPVLTDKVMSEFVVSLFQDYQECMKQTDSFPFEETENRPGTVLLILACTVLLKRAHLIFQKENKIHGYYACLYQAALLLQHGLHVTKYDFRLKLLAIMIAGLLGAPDWIHSLYQSLEIKNIQLDSLGYMIFPWLDSFPSTKQWVYLNRYISFSRDNAHNGKLRINQCFEHSSFAMVTSAVQFFSSLFHSIQRLWCNVAHEELSFLQAEDLTVYFGPSLTSVNTSKLSASKPITTRANIHIPNSLASYILTGKGINDASISVNFDISPVSSLFCVPLDAYGLRKNLLVDTAGYSECVYQLTRYRTSGSDFSENFHRFNQFSEISPFLFHPLLSTRNPDQILRLRGLFPFLISILINDPRGSPHFSQVVSSIEKIWDNLLSSCLNDQDVFLTWDSKFYIAQYLWVFSCWNSVFHFSATTVDSAVIYPKLLSFLKHPQISSFPVLVSSFCSCYRLCTLAKRVESLVVSTKQDGTLSSTSTSNESGSDIYYNKMMNETAGIIKEQIEKVFCFSMWISSSTSGLEKPAVDIKKYWILPEDILPCDTNEVLFKTIIHEQSEVKKKLLQVFSE